jgi:homoserine dehydrogenase
LTRTRDVLKIGCAIAPNRLCVGLQNHFFGGGSECHSCCVAFALRAFSAMLYAENSLVLKNLFGRSIDGYIQGLHLSESGRRLVVRECLEPMELKLAFIGMGNVGRAFVRLLQRKQVETAKQYGITWVATAIATASHGSLISQTGLDLGEAVRRIESGRSIAGLGESELVPTAAEAIGRCHADIVFETTPLNPADGEPAISHIREAFLRGMCVVTANKGPIAFAYRQLSRLAAERGVMFRFEGTVMDGCPVFNLAELCLPSARVLSFCGVLNSTSNLILTGMEDGRSMEECLAEAQQLGIAEADADYDLDGWDAAIKAVALANVLMGVDADTRAVERLGIKQLTPEDVKRASAEGQALRLVARADRSSVGAKISVRPERLPRSSAMGCVRGTSNVLILKTDVMGEIAVFENDPGIDQTAYALLSDMIRVHEELSRSPAKV